MDGSLHEINRVLRPSGLLFVFMLPNRYSWVEWISDRLNTSKHPVKFTFQTTTSLLNAHGFVVERRWKRNFLPRNLTGLGPRFKRAYGTVYRKVEAINRILANVPPTSFLSGVLEFRARKRRQEAAKAS